MSHQRWQYTVIELKSGLWGLKNQTIQDELNRLGQQGWELVTIQMIGMAIRAVLKRPQ